MCLSELTGWSVLDVSICCLSHCQLDFPAKLGAFRLRRISLMKQLTRWCAERTGIVSKGLAFPGSVSAQLVSAFPLHALH